MTRDADVRKPLAILGRKQLNRSQHLCRYLAALTNGSPEMPTIAGAALLCNSGPRKAMPTREWFAAQRSLWHSARVIWWMLKRPVHDARLVRDMFFSTDLPETDFQRCNPAVSISAPNGAERVPISTLAYQQWKSPSTSDGAWLWQTTPKIVPDHTHDCDSLRLAFDSCAILDRSLQMTLPRPTPGLSAPESSISHPRRYHEHISMAAQVMPISAQDMKQKVELGPSALPPVFVLGGADDGIVRVGVNCLQCRTKTLHLPCK